MGSCPARHCKRNFDARLFHFYVFSGTNGFQTSGRFMFFDVFLRLFDNMFWPKSAPEVSGTTLGPSPTYSGQFSTHFDKNRLKQYIRKNPIQIIYKKWKSFRAPPSAVMYSYTVPTSFCTLWAMDARGTSKLKPPAQQACWAGPTQTKLQRPRRIWSSQTYRSCYRETHTHFIGFVIEELLWIYKNYIRIYKIV